jgi:uncharacterized membrane protein
MMDWNGHGEHMTTGGWILMAFGMSILLLLVVVLIIWMVSHLRQPAGAALPPGMSAREALDHRLVSGEITTGQYDELRAKLDAAGASPAAGPPSPPAPG